MKLNKLEQSLGYHFKSSDLLIRALTHRSHSAHHNERLEFLGDSILNFAVAALLFNQLEHENEGDLSRIRSSLVNQTTLAKLAKQIRLSDYLRLGEGELKSGGFRRPSILADAMEAIFAAIYMDSGMAEAQEVVDKLYTPLVAGIDVKTAGKDSKTLLQEIVQSQHLQLPVYEIKNTLGEAHNQEFIVQCKIAEFGIVTEASGSSRRQAEQEAAHLAIDQINSKISDLKKGKKHRKVSQLKLDVAMEQDQKA